MEKSQWYLGTPNGVILCIDEAENGRLGGRFYHAYESQATRFSTIEEAIFGLERLYDSLNFPYPTTNKRSFYEEGQQRNCREERARIMKDEELLNKHGDLGTFIVRVQHRQNSSWQGRLTWMDQNKTVYFRSIWEMIKLVEEALNTVSEQENSPQDSWKEEE